MKRKIGETAGEVWEVLKKKGKVNIAQLPRALKEKSVIVYQALGWLAREDKIIYHKSGDKVFVSLTESERKAQC